MNPWPFAEPPNLAVIVNRKIIHEGDWIAYVSHDADDDGWQFFGRAKLPLSCSDEGFGNKTSSAGASPSHIATPDGNDAVRRRRIGLGEILELDETIAELADLAPGWHAWRESPASAWQRAKSA